MTRKGRLVAVTPIGPKTDWENLMVSNSPGFRALIERSRRLYPAGSGLTPAQVRQGLRRGRRTRRRSLR